MSIERDFDVPMVAAMALREKQIQQNYRPIIGVHKWFARRPGTLFRGLILAEFGNGPLQDTFFANNDLSGWQVADPFMGGGTPLIEANRLGCDVRGFDVNPMSAWIVREEIEHLDIKAYERAAKDLVATLHEQIGAYYRTRCPLYGDTEVPVKSFLWVKTLDCSACGDTFDLFPGYLLAANRRHPKNVVVCSACGELAEVADRAALGSCTTCGAELRLSGPARRGRCDCPRCGYPNVYPRKDGGPLQHRMFAIEYYNHRRKGEHPGRFFKRPDAEDLARSVALDIFSVHGFPVGLVQCESKSNLLGISSRTGANVGSGGWTNIIDKFAKAKRYCAAPFEVRRNGSRNVQVPITGEWIGEQRDGRRRLVDIRCADAAHVELAPRSLDAVFTDPPYFGNVQYGELMDFCYAWLRRLVGDVAEGFDRPSTRSSQELTGNVTEDRGLDHFTEGLASVYTRMARALKPGAPLAFTFHHNKLQAYFAVGIAILEAGLVCSASLPCPAEMGGSIHIHGTDSSIIDTVFVCRSTGTVPRRWLADTPDAVAVIVADDIALLEAAGRTPTRGDMRCIIFGHLTRLAVWHLRTGWDKTLATATKIATFAGAVARFGSPDSVIGAVQPTTTIPPHCRLHARIDTGCGGA